MIATLLRIVLRRLLAAVPILVLVSMMLFGILRLLPVDPAAMSVPPNATREEIETVRRDMGLDRPIPEQYVRWALTLLRGDFGTSIHYRKPVGPLLAETLPATIELALAALVVAGFLGIGGGLGLFHVRGTWKAAVGDLGSTALMSIPSFLWAIILILIFAVAFRAMPVAGRLDMAFARPPGTGFLLLDAILAGRLDLLASAAKHLVLPAFALGLSFSPPIMRVLRSGLHDVYAEDYIRQARLRGLDEGRILIGHAARNAMLPTATLLGVQFGFLFGGTLLVEVLFSFPGMGGLMVEAVRNTDLPVIQAIGLTYCLVVLAVNAVTDIVCLLLDPRLRAN
ncbi:MAG: ABC transporter permease [Alphaproteobacteria bacterium]|nr:ABC transporter permease [Alphaproteobacteria bacterium]